MDVKSAFLHGDLKEEIYMRQPKGYIEYSSLACKLRKSLYGIKQPPRAWYSKMDSFLMSNKFERHIFECNVYMDQKGGSLFFIVLYVDGLLFGSISAVGLRSIKSALSEAFTMTDLGLLKQFTSLEVSQKTSGIIISQSRYSSNLLKIFHMEYYKETPFLFLCGIRI